MYRSLDGGIKDNLLYQNTIYSYKRQKILKTLFGDEQLDIWKNV